MKIEKKDNSTYYSDPAFITIGFHYVQTSGTKLFGSDMEHSNIVVLEICEAENIRNNELSYDKPFSKKKIIEIALSPTQFSELLTQMNMGTGIPGTLLYKDGVNYKMPDMPTRKDQFEDELKDDIENTRTELESAVSHATELLSQSKPLNSKEKSELLSQIKSVSRLFNDHLPFLGWQFSKMMSKIVVEAKSSIEAFAVHVIHQTGVETIQKNMPKLTDKEDKEKIL